MKAAKRGRPKSELDVATLLEEDHVDDFTQRDCHLYILIESSDQYSSKVKSFVKNVQTGLHPRIKAVTVEDIVHIAKDRYKEYQATGKMISNVIKHIVKRFKEEDMEEIESLSKHTDTTDLVASGYSESIPLTGKKMTSKDSAKKTTNHEKYKKKDIGKKKTEKDIKLTKSIKIPLIKLDVPVGSPRFHIVLTGLTDVNLIIEIMLSGIPIISIIKAGTENIGDVINTLSPIKTFWNELPQICESQDKVRDISFIKCDIEGLNDSEFDLEVVKILFSLATIYRHYLNFKSCNKIQRVPQVVQPVNLKEMLVYNNLMDLTLPNDIDETVSYLLYCIIEQVSFMVDKQEESFVKYEGFCKVDISDAVSTIYSNLPVCKLWNTLIDNKDESEYLYYNYHLYRLQHCVNNDVNRETLCECLNLTTLHDMRKHCDMKSKEIYDINSQYENKFFKTLPSTEFNGETQKKSCSTFKSPNEQDCTKVKHHSKLRKFLLCPEIFSLPPSIEENEMNSYSYIERVKPKQMYKLLNKAWNETNSYTYKYFKLTDNILLLFYNKHDFQNVWSKSWLVDVRTPIGFRDFVSYIFEEEKEWLKEFETKHSMTCEKETMTKKPLTQQQLDHITELKELSKTLKCTSKTQVTNKPTNESNVNTEGSKVEIGDEANSKNSAIEDLGMRFFKSDSIENYNCIMYDDLPIRIHNAGKILEFFTEDNVKLKLEQSEWSHEKVSNLYLEVMKSGHTLSTSITTSSTQLSTIQITAASNVTMTLSKITPRLFNVNENVHLIKDSKSINENHLLVPKKSISKRKQSQPKLKINNTEEDTMITMKKDQNLDMTKEEQCSYLFDCLSSINLKISCYNNLHIETKNKENIFYIKQMYLTQPDNFMEKYRCFLRNGTVIKFMNDDTNEVLCSDGTMYVCTIINNSKIDKKKCCSIQVNENIDTQAEVKLSENIGATNESTRAHLSEESKPKFISSDEVLSSSKNCKIGYTSVTTPWGMQKCSSMKKESNYLALKVAVDKWCGDVYMKREDGFTSYLRNDGTLIIKFYDGTVISSSYVIESEAIFCEWTRKEVRSLNMEGILEDARCTTEEGISNLPHSETEEVRLKESEGYVSVHLRIKIDHPNYAAIEYDNASNEVFISIYQGINVHIHGNSKCDIALDNDNMVRVNDDSVDISSNSFIHTKLFWTKINENLLCTTSDSKNNTFNVYYDGKVSVSHQENNSSSQDSGRWCQHFILNKDMSGKRVIHGDEALEYITHVKALKGGSVYEYNISEEPLCKIYNIFHPLTIEKKVDIPVPEKLTFLDLKRIQLGQSAMWLHFHPEVDEDEHCADHDLANLFTNEEQPMTAKRVFHKIGGWHAILKAGINEYIDSANVIHNQFVKPKEETVIYKLKNPKEDVMVI